MRVQQKRTANEGGWNLCTRARAHGGTGGVCEARRAVVKCLAETANLGRVKTSGCICVRAETRRGLWLSEGFSLAWLIPRPSHPFRACLRSGSLALRADDSAPPARFNMLCVPAPPTPLHLNHHCPRAGPLLLRFKEPAKGTFQAG